MRPKTVGPLEQDSAEQIDVEIGDHHAFLADADGEPVLIDQRHGCRLDQLNFALADGESVETAAYVMVDRIGAVRVAGPILVTFLGVLQYRSAKERPALVDEYGSSLGAAAVDQGI